MTRCVRPVVVPAVPDDVAGMLHEPAAAARRDGAVLLCPPWGWEEVASARGRRILADAIADAGLPVLRIDLPGCGDSAGHPRDPDRLGAWTAAICAGAAWLRGRPGTQRVAIVGLGLSGLLARVALARGAPAEDLVLWGAPASGRVFIRQMRAFAKLTGLPPEEGDDALAVAGFVLSAQTIAALETFEPSGQAAGMLRRALVLDEASPRGSAADGLADQGVGVDADPAPGWAELTSHPEQSELHPDVARRMGTWLAAETARAAAPRAPVPRRAVMALCDGRLTETAVAVQAPRGQLSGVLTRPAGEAQDRCVVFLNAGAVRHVGPDRLWVEAARRIAAEGVPSIRIDLGSVGDSDAMRPEGAWRVHEFYETDGDAQMTAILDTAAGIGRELMIVGLCSGGYWGFRSASDPRVRCALVANAGAFEWDRQAQARDELRRVSKLRDPAWWRKLASGGVDLRLGRLRSMGSAMLRGGTAAPAGHVDALRARFDGLRDSSTRLVLAFTDGEPAYEELEREGIIADLERWPNVVLEWLPGADHTLRPLAAQAAFHGLLDRELSGATVTAG